jgi:hypothetical protein
LDRYVSHGQRGAKRLIKGRVMCTPPTGKGYPHLVLARDGKTYTKEVHTLVAEAFISPRPDGLQAAHWDGKPTNNKLDNIRWATPKSNQADRIRHGTDTRGKDHGASHLTDDDVIQMRRRYGQTGVTLKALASEFGVHRAAVHAIIKRRSWAHIPASPDDRHSPGKNKSKLTADQVSQIRRRFAAGGVKRQVLADEFGVTIRNINLILRRATWKHIP